MSKNQECEQDALRNHYSLGKLIIIRDNQQINKKQFPWKHFLLKEKHYSSQNPDN